VETPDVLTELLDSVMDRNLTLRQEGLKFQLAHLSQTACLRQDKPLLLEKRYREFPLRSYGCPRAPRPQSLSPSFLVPL
jgi:hypothetical protein